MTDPLVSPLGPEDAVYGDAGPLSLPPTIDAKEERIRAVERIRDRERDELAAVLNTAAGQAVLMRILAHCKPYHSTFSSDPATYGVSEGRRSVGLWLLSEMQRLDPEMYAKLLLHRVKAYRDATALEIGQRPT